MIRLVAVIQISIILVLSPNAAAQGIFVYVPSINRRQVESISRILALREEQREVVRLLHQGYLREAAQAEAEKRDSAEAFSRRLENIDSEIDPDAVLEIRLESGEVALEYFRRKTKLQDRLLDDIHATLDEEQATRWPRVIRKRRRDLILGDMMGLSWAEVDLVDCLETLEIQTHSGELLDQIIRYEIDLDRPLTRIHLVFIELGELDAKQTPHAITYETQAKTYESSAQLRTINQRHARIVATMLSKEDRVRFEDLVHRRAFPEVYDRAQFQVSMRAAQGLADLSVEQGEALRNLLSRYESQISSVRDRVVAATLKFDDSLDPRKPYNGRFERTPEKIELSEAWKQRSGRDEIFIGYMEAILSVEQLQALRSGRDG